MSGTPELFHYLRKYQENPTSRIFAPLAEAYRKAGLLDEAIDIAREGLTHHPGFVGGRVALARSLFDKKDYRGVLEELRQVIQDVPDNVIAQRLVAESNLILGRVAEALDAYKMLLYLSPEDRELGRIVQELESQAYREGTLVLESQAAQFQILPGADALENDPDYKKKKWVQSIETLQNMLQRIENYRNELL